ncbi:MAG: beta-N-acetylhexosaminidase [Clostridia bacterium]
MVKIIPKPQAVEVLSDKRFTFAEETLKKVSAEGHGKEGYALSIGEDGITAYASEDAGYFYALMTLKQLYDEDGSLPHIYIKDAPAYPYRGYMLDCARHFFSVDTVKKQIDAISLLKMNVFHWHLTEDQGWRLQLDNYPLFTEKGSYRAGTRGDGVPVSGFYTKDEVRDVIAYAAKRHIEVIPEIDMPGHMSAAIAAYPEISCTGNPIEVKDSFGIHREVACAGKESVYEFLFGVLGEVADLFPSEYIHLGGDEALRLNWLDCPDCKAKMKEEGIADEHGLQAHFMYRMVEFLKTKGKRVINWNDGMVSEDIHSDITLHYWIENKVGKSAAAREMDKGRPTIFSPFFSYYLDYPHGMTPLKKTYLAYPMVEGAKKDANIIGVESPLWTEYVPTEEKLEYQSYPRTIAVAETGWSGGENKDYANFLSRMEKVLKLFDKKGIKYATIKDANPGFFAGKWEVIKFFKNSWEKTQMQSVKRINENRRRLKALDKERHNS